MAERQLDVSTEDLALLIAQNPINEILTPMGQALLKVIVLDRMLTAREAAEMDPSNGTIARPEEILAEG